ncbi:MULTISPECIES: OmpA family protein [Pseudomonas]|uniref:OmpA family protein n=1 Tax=Pseudomonas TaxID=286 RepID=UPI001AE94467|nr:MULTISPECIES: OmpA family protein [unclassified Pseudomonas]MBP2272086.1 outer membrane protein OmpA-like peptidoglycan-associated protein [Pseudomonas sp. BP6]MBP2288943.1 outer membrane protein OmpA-like peptidoglycan-associated protein [Pseudomonas sp. BP7]HDS1697167.1 OmpA family protein [Pseudomonas putida]HDS1702286.1 OmpA family protein [Pseudomonas putida]
MQLRQVQGLWLWAGTLFLVLIAMLPLAIELQLTSAVVVTVAVWAAWRRSKRVADEGRELRWAKGASLPAGSYRHPVVLVVGDCLAELFGPVPAEQWELRVTGEGCYVRVPDVQKLPTTVTSLLLQRPEWNDQLSVMWVVDPTIHTDAAVLANKQRSVSRQVVKLRERGNPLSLLVVGYFQSTSQTPTWFIWAAAKSRVQVHESGECMSLAQWQRWGTAPDSRAARLRDAVQLNAAAGWLNDVCMSEIRVRASRQESAAATVVAVAWAPISGRHPENNLWHRWLHERTGLCFDQGVTDEANRSLPFPDALLHLLPRGARNRRPHRAVLMGGWLFVLAGSIALASSAWQNTLLVRQVTDDLRRYDAASASAEPDRQTVRETALDVLHQDAERLDHYYRQGAPWSLGLGLYQGEKLRPSLMAAINGHRIPTTPQASPDRPQMVRLDSLSLFSSGSAQLKPQSTKVLVTALAGIKAQPGWLIVITGHTDATGNDENNLRLSRARASAVHDWIQLMGDIPSNCFAVQGLGASQPIASNETEQGRSANRRVEIRLVPEAGACLSSTAASGLQPQSHSATSNT